VEIKTLGGIATMTSCYLMPEVKHALSLGGARPLGKQYTKKLCLDPNISLMVMCLPNGSLTTIMSRSIPGGATPFIKKFPSVT
jgi:hypothetical protein